jgi:integrase
LEQAGLEDFRWHDLRHTWASIMRQGGVSLDVLQELGGWKQQRMVQRYAHLTVAHLMSHSNRFDDLLGTPHVQKRHSG